jgi:hypothetical protein
MKSFLKHITEKKFATKEQRKKEIWDVEGRLKNGNQVYKFDIRPLIKTNNREEKEGFFDSLSDKIVFEEHDKWLVFDTEELHEYIKSQNKRDFNSSELLKILSWNLIITK